MTDQVKDTHFLTARSVERSIRRAAAVSTPAVTLLRGYEFAIGLYIEAGYAVQAVHAARAAVTLAEEKLDPKDRNIAATHMQLWGLLFNSGRHDEAIDVRRHAIDWSAQYVGAGNPDHKLFLQQHARHLRLIYRPADALSVEMELAKLEP